MDNANSTGKTAHFKKKVFPYFSTKWQSAKENKEFLKNELLFLAGFSSMDEFLRIIAPKTCAIYIAAGVGMRWQDSLRDDKNKSLVKTYKVDRNKSRSLVLIQNLIPGTSPEKIAIGAYNVHAIAGIVSKLIIVHAARQRENIEKAIVAPLSLHGRTEYIEQYLYPGNSKPSGHADALIQLLNSTRNRKASQIFKASTFAIICLSGVPSSRSTVELTLLAMYVLDRYKKNVSWLSPTTLLDESRYPFKVDKKGRITGIGHAKLFGKKSILHNGSSLPNNIGIGVFKTADVIPILKSVNKQYMKLKSYNGVFHGTKTDEFALDHIMANLIKKKRLFILNTADRKELENEVKRIESIPKFIQDMKDILSSESKSIKMTVNEVIKHINHITKCLENNPHNIVILDPNPLTRGIGVGHSRQNFMMKLFLRKCKADDLITHVSLSYLNSAGFIARLGFNLYKFIQARPKLYDMVHFFLKLLGNNKLIDSELAKTDMSDEVIINLKRSANFNQKRSTIFITTHVAEAVTAINLINNHGIKAKVLEYIPDPFPPVILQMMSSPITSPNHLVIVHDRGTVTNLKSIRKDKIRRNHIYPLGTLSNYTFMLQKSDKIKVNPIIHIGIEFGGNYLFGYDQKVFAFIRSIADKVRCGKVKLTVHTMYHRKTYDNLLLLLQELGLNYGAGKNIRIIHCEDAANPAAEAIKTREAYITGSLEDGWSSPEAVISKGGETTIEHRGNMLIVAIYGAGHERIDAQVGVKENRTINCIDIPVENLLEEIMKNLETRKRNMVSPPQSLAIFGILSFLDPDYFKKYILLKIP